MAYPGAGGQATLTTGSISHLPAEYWSRKALDQLWKRFLFREPCVMFALPKGEGTTIKWFRYANLGAMTTARVLGAPGGGGVTEGVIGSGTTISDAAITATVSQYTNFIAVSDAVQDLSFNDELRAAADQLGYQAGLSVDTITRTEIDSAAGSVMAVAGSYLRTGDISAAKTVLEAADVPSMEDGFFMGIAHPYAAYDFKNDPSVGGYFDLNKYSNPEELKKSANLIGIFDGVKLYKSTNVKIDTTTTPDTYRTYVFGKGAVAAVDLQGRGPTGVVDPSKERFKINIVPGGKPDKTDPEGVIGGIASYNYWYVAKLLQTTLRHKMLDHAVSLVTT